LHAIKIGSSVNRIKSLNYLPIVAFWSENAEVTVMDLKQEFISLGGDHID